MEEPTRVMNRLARQATTPELRAALERAATALGAQLEVGGFAAELGCRSGVSGFVLHTVPVALYAWLRHATDFRAAVEAVVLLGGDTDTTGSIVGALAGGTLGQQAIPALWVERLVDWPRSIEWMRRLGARLARAFPAQGVGEQVGPEPLFWPALLPRNLFFLTIVLAHGFRRVLPPW